MKSKKEKNPLLVVERRLEKEINRDFEPAFMRKWEGSNSGHSPHSVLNTGTSYKGISNHIVHLGQDGYATLSYRLHSYEKKHRSINHRLGGPAYLGIYRNKVIKVEYYLFHTRISALEYWSRMIAIAPSVYNTKLIGSKLFIQSTSKAIPAPTYIDYHKEAKSRCVYALKNRKISEEKFWTIWEQRFTILDEYLE